MKVGVPKVSRPSESTKGHGDRPSRVPSSKSSERRSKGICSSSRFFQIAEEDMGSEAFMRELRAMESDVPWHSRCGESYLDQFGSFYAEPNSVGSILMKVQGRSRAPLRTVNLLDEVEEEEKEMPEPPPKVIMEEEEETSVRGRETEVQILGEEDAN